MPLTADEIWCRLDALTKPPRSLGRLEELAVRLCQIQQSLTPVTQPRRLVLFAGDHGVVASGVSAWPSEVTSLMMQTIREGGAASTVFARQTSTEVVLVNVGVGDAENLPCKPTRHAIQYRDARVRSGTRNLAIEPAPSPGEFSQALEVGRQEAAAAVRDAVRVVIAGEMGIGNTTSSACLSMLLADVPLSEAVGRGAGADDLTMERKRQIINTAVLRSRNQLSTDPVAAIAGVAGLEIAAMAGFMMSAHATGLTVILDGYVATAAALVAEHLQPGTAQSMIAAHLSAEPGHRQVLHRLGLQPFLDWNLRLGEGTGGLLLLPLLDLAAAMIGGMATLKSLGIQGQPRA